MQRLLCFALAIAPLLFAPSALAAKRKLPTDFESTEGAKLKHLMDEPDAAKKIALLEDFAKQHPSHDAIPWVYGELQAAYVKANQLDKALAAGEKVLAADPEDVAMGQANLKAAEATKDPALIRKWAVASLAAAGRVTGSPKPTGADEATAWQADADFAKQVGTYSEYVLYTLAMQATAPAQRIEVAELLAKHNPSSQYNAPLRTPLFVAYQQAGHADKALSMAEADIKGGSDSEDMLLFAASKAYEKQDKAKVTTYAKRLLDTLPAKPVPQGMNEADWTRVKNLKLGMAQWMLGVLASNEQRWADADLHLRAALPNVSQNKDIHAETLFHLGLANYRLGEAKKDSKRILDAVKYNQQCAAINSNFQAQAKKNVAAIRSQYHLQ
ncbi:MAG: hypothetical protein HYX27_04380 [Acidobacteria bacterium]|nr:hypothetical protein [Acidobacteriota bacterium]